MDGMKIEEVAVRLGVSVQTLNRWYKFKRTNPKDDMSRHLPMYKKVKHTTGFVRIWTDTDLEKLVEFKQLVKRGRTGKMGEYKGKGPKNGKKKIRRSKENNA